MTILMEGALTFSFDGSCQATKYDAWSFYRNQFMKTCGGAKAIDFLCMSEGISWLIEVKDYRAHARTKPIDLAQEVAEKVRDTLAGLAAAKTNANDLDEKGMAQSALGAQHWRVVLHLEQPAKRSRLHPQTIDPANITLKLRQALKAIDPHACVVDQRGLRGRMCWAVSG